MLSDSESNNRVCPDPSHFRCSVHHFVQQCSLCYCPINLSLLDVEFAPQYHEPKVYAAPQLNRALLTLLQLGPILFNCRIYIEFQVKIRIQ